MSLANIINITSTGFAIPRYTDREIVDKVDSLAQEFKYTINKSNYLFLFSDQTADYSSEKRPQQLEELLNINSTSIKRVIFTLNDKLRLTIERPQEQNRQLAGNLDFITIAPADSNIKPNVTEITTLIAVARKRFGAVDTKPFTAYLDEGSKALYQSREQDLNKLERMQESFFKGMTEFTLEQQKKQQEFQHKLETEYASRQSKLEEQHQERLKQFEEKEAELKKVRAEIDDRENRQARRDIYKELKAKLDARNTSFELTTGTRNRRRVTFWFTAVLLIIFGGMFGYCFRLNVVEHSEKTNWAAVGSQTGFGIAFIGVATFFIRWNNQWFQKHADEEFKLKRLDLDIDRANWLVELAMEWKNINKTEIPSELIDKLAKSLFVTDESKEIDIHPAETLLSAIFGKAGSMNVEFPGKWQLQRNDKEGSGNNAKDGKS